ncbi:LysR family transcriptional regulator [Kiloniella litopenaei]|uniref:LysR family transcriptional regulator n=1 Tax=Kiloniella litopenaei TaxID=1549748 RepID=A0A0M2RA19_9PROT|nr:LysR family transcriptional regulator [Kiloniella litopenaei]KKJ76840.1 LysR family transcriptional regulator [Kiloniella litopenaei]
MAVAPPRPQIPPLNSLRAFEAAARLGGFSLAADELCVTPGAVAQHVKSLEAWVGADLFIRRSQGVELTELGQNVLSEFSAAFDQLGLAVQTLRSQATPKHIRIAALPSIAQLWLSPKLPSVREAASDLTISVTAMEKEPNLQREPFDLSIFYQDNLNSPKDTFSTTYEVCKDIIFPVCSPQVAKRLKVPEDLEKELCLHDASWAEDWTKWVACALPHTPLNTDGSVFSLYGLAIEEARNGAGIMMGHQALVEHHLENGSLVAPFDTSLTLDRALVIATAQSARNNPYLELIITTLLGK